MNLFILCRNRVLNQIDAFGLVDLYPVPDIGDTIGDWIYDLILDIWGDEIVEWIMRNIGAIKLKEYGPSECQSPMIRFLSDETVVKDKHEQQTFSPFEKSVWQVKTVLQISVLRLYECRCPCDVVFATRSSGSKVTDWSSWEYWGILWVRHRNHIGWVDWKYKCGSGGVVD